MVKRRAISRSGLLKAGQHQLCLVHKIASQTKDARKKQLEAEMETMKTNLMVETAGKDAALAQLTKERDKRVELVRKRLEDMGISGWRLDEYEFMSA